MNEIPHHETATKKLNKLTPKKAVEVNLHDIADMLHEQGLPEQAAEVRANAANQEPEGHSFKVFQEMEEAKHRKIEDEATKREPRPFNPLLNTHIAGTKTQAEVDKIIGKVDQNKPPVPTSAPKGPSPSGGK